MASNCLGLTRLSQLCLFNSESLPGSSWVPFLPTMLSGKFIKAEYWDNHSAHFICFLSIKAHLSTLLDVQCLKNCYFSYFCLFFFVVSGGRVNLVPVTPSWADTEVHTPFLGKQWQRESSPVPLCIQHPNEPPLQYLLTAFPLLPLLGEFWDSSFGSKAISTMQKAIGYFCSSQAYMPHSS